MNFEKITPVDQTLLFPLVPELIVKLRTLCHSNCKICFIFEFNDFLFYFF